MSWLDCFNRASSLRSSGLFAPIKGMGWGGDESTERTRRGEDTGKRGKERREERGEERREER